MNIVQHLKRLNYKHIVFDAFKIEVYAILSFLITLAFLYLVQIIFNNGQSVLAESMLASSVVIYCIAKLYKTSELYDVMKLKSNKILFFNMIGFLQFVFYFLILVLYKDVNVTDTISDFLIMMMFVWSVLIYKCFFRKK